MNDTLALANACLSAASLSCVLLGVRAIRRKQIARHKALMLAAFGSSAVFLALFVFRFVRFGFEPHEPSGVQRVIFLFVFFTHEPLSVVTVPLVTAALLLALARSFASHRELARMAVPIWVYSLTTGLALYVLMYVIG